MIPNHSPPSSSPTETTRRRFLRAATALAALAGVGTAGAESGGETFRFGGEVGGWQGRSPDAIADETNPPLRLEAGTKYEITWENVDGQPHNVALLDADDNTLERTEIISKEGATQSMTFTAREEMASYICEVHPTSMRGEILFGEETATTEKKTSAEPYIPNGPTVRLETVADGDLTAPLDMEVPPGGSDMYIVDRFGQVYLRTDDGLREEPFVDLEDRIVEITGEMGLLGLAFHPDYQENKKFYLRYSAPSRDGTPEEYDHTEVLSEFTASDDGKSADLDSERTVLEIPHPYDTHNSGAITFGPDGYLYMGMGDGGGAHDTGRGHVSDWYDRFEGGNGQNVSENLLGSVLRIDVDSRDGDKAYGIPEDNPLVGKAGLDEYFAWGLRNPWRMGFSNGDLYASDVGQNLFEEVDRIEKGNNYGWNVREGTHCFKPGPEGSRNPPDSCPTHTPEDVRGGEPLVDPVIEYPHAHEGTGVGSAAIGGYFYENDALSALTGKYVFGDFRKTKETDAPTGSLFVATPSDDGLWDLEDLRIENTDSGFVGGYVLAIGRDDDGELYALTTDSPGDGSSGRVQRIVPSKNPQQAGTTRTTTTNGTATNGTATNGTATNQTANTTATNGMAGNDTPANTTATGTSNATTAGTANATAAETATETGRATDTAASTSGKNSTTSSGSTGTSSTAANGTDGSSGGSGPGFGTLAALSALAVGAARYLRRRDD